MNWIQIDRQILGLMRLTNDNDKLYEDVKHVFKWNDSQVEAAVRPLIERWDWYGMHKDEKPVKKKRATKKAPAKKAKATKKKS